MVYSLPSEGTSLGNLSLPFDPSHEKTLHPLGWYPPCFGSLKEYEAWQRAVLFCLVVSDRPDTYCSDCTPQYKRRMVEEGKCLHPDTIFLASEDEDGTYYLTGYRERPKQSTRKYVR